MKPQPNTTHKSFQRAAASRYSPPHAVYLYKAVRAGTPNIALINRSIVSPVAITDWPQMDQLCSNLADDMNAEKLPIVPTTSFTSHQCWFPSGTPPAARIPVGY